MDYVLLKMKICKKDCFTVCSFIEFFKFIKTIKQLKKTYKNYLIFIALSGVGDACYGLSVLNKLKKERNRKVLLVAGEYTASLGGYYDYIDDTIVLNAEEEKIFKTFLNKKRNIFVYNKISLKCGVFNCFPLTEKVYKRLTENKNYIEVLSDALHKKTVIPECPQIKKKISVTDYFKNPDKVIIINPFSNSLSFNNIDVFLKMIEMFKLKGYSIYTNVVGYQEALPDTMPLRCSIEELYLLSQSIKLFVSIRSGITDFCVGSGGNFLVLYDDSWNGAFKKAYTLYAWKTESNICELDYRDTEKILKKIQADY